MLPSLGILHVIDSGGLYGAEIMLLELVEEQLKLGLRPIIASIGNKGIKEKALEMEGLRRGLAVERFRMRPGPNYMGTRAILRYARRMHIDILHVHGYKGDILFGFIPRFVRRLPLVSTLHGWTNTGRLNRMWFYEALDAASLRFMDAVVLVDEQMRFHPRLYNRPALRLQVVSNGISSLPPSSTLSGTDSAVEAFCSKGRTVGTIGRLSPEKGHDQLLVAAKALVEDFPDLQLVFIGDGRLGPELNRKATELGLGSRVMFAGYRDRACAYLPLLDTFVLPSLTEGLPITLLEAMRAGCPIVATAVGGIPAALDHGAAGILVPPGETRSLTEGIRSMLNNPEEAQRIARAARQIFDDRFSSRRMAERYADIYRTVVH